MASAHQGSFATFARRLGSHSGIYAGGAGGTFLFALANVAVLTRLLPIEDFGRLAVCLVFAAMLTVIYNLGTLQGTLMSVFGVADGGEEAADEVDTGPQAEDRERALTTGVLITMGIATIGTLTVFAAAPLAAELLGLGGEVEAVRLAALAGATGAIWRLVHNVMRFERRPVAYTMLGLVRPALALGLGVALVVSGYGVEGALAGIAIGTALAVLVAIAATHRDYALGVDLGVVRPILTKGSSIVPIIAAIWVIHNADLFLVSAYAPEDAVGPYRVASRLGAGISYLVSAVTMSWIPLTRTSLYTAMDEEHGKTTFGATLLTVFLLLCIWALLGLTLLAHVLIRIAPESYESAAPLVPLIGLGVVLYGAFMVIFRGSAFPKRGKYRLWLLLAAVGIFIGLGLILVPIYGGYGAAVSQIVAFAVATAVMLWRSQISENPLPIQYGRLGRGLAIGIGCVVLGQFLAPLAGDSRWLLDVGIIIAFPVLLVLARAFPLEELRAFIEPKLFGRPRRPSSAMLSDLERLDPLDRQAVSTLARKGGSPAQAARELSEPEPAVLERLVVSLRFLAPHDREGPGDRDVEIAGYLLADDGRATRDQLGARLCKEGVDPLDLDMIELTFTRLRRIPARRWERFTR